jgi:general secretion pathway protein L
MWLQGVAIGMLDEFLTWWLTQWRDMLPRSWRERGADRTPFLVLTPDRLDEPASVGVSIMQAGIERKLGRVTPEAGGGKALGGLLGNRARPGTLVLRVPTGTVLARDVTLPLAAERDLSRVLAYEMDRLTPFSAGELFFSHEIVKRDRAAGRVLLRLLLAPRAGLEALIEQMGRAGLAPDAIEAREPDGSHRRIILAARGGSAGRSVLVERAAWALAACLAILCLVVPFVRQSGELSASAATIAELRPRVATVTAVRSRIEAATAGADVLAAAQRDIGDPLETLASLTDLLPDDTFLTDLSLTGRKLTINGQSASAAKLIGLLSTEPSLGNPSFVAPVTRLETSHTDLFSIRADVIR